MKRVLLLLPVFLALFLVACGRQAVPELEERTPSAVDVPIATGEPDVYPPPSSFPPSAAYPEMPAEPVPNPYPDDGEITLLHAWGTQCVDPSLYDYADLEAAIADLEAAGVEVLDSGLTTLPVCEACRCATPEHFRVRINLVDIPRAEALGWFRE